MIIADLRLTADARKIVDSDDKVIFQETDVTKWADLQRLIDTSVSTLGDIPDIFVACAGVFEPVSMRQTEIRQVSQANM